MKYTIELEMEQGMVFNFNGRGDGERQLAQKEEMQLRQGMKGVRLLVNKRRFARAADVFLALYKCDANGQPYESVNADQRAFEQGVI